MMETVVLGWGRCRAGSMPVEGVVESKWPGSWRVAGGMVRSAISDLEEFGDKNWMVVGFMVMVFVGDMVRLWIAKARLLVKWWT